MNILNQLEKMSVGEINVNRAVVVDLNADIYLWVCEHFEDNALIDCGNATEFLIREFEINSMYRVDKKFFLPYYNPCRGNNEDDYEEFFSPILFDTNYHSEQRLFIFEYDNSFLIANVNIETDELNEELSNFLEMYNPQYQFEN